MTTNESAPDPTAGERLCRYPCGCEQFPEDHCSCMDGHATPDADDASEPLTEAERSLGKAWYDLDSQPHYTFTEATVEGIVATREAKARAEGAESAYAEGWDDAHARFCSDASSCLHLSHDRAARIARGDA